MSEYNFIPEERETIINLSDADKQWEVFTMQKKIIHKLEKIGAKPYKEEKDEDGNIISASYKLEYSQISFRKKGEKRILTDEQRQILRDRMAKARSKK